MSHPFIVGNMRWGVNDAHFSNQQAADFLTQAFEHGFGRYDLADIYGRYSNEALFGRALACSSVKRTDIEIITKCGIMLAGHADYTTQGYDTRRSHIIASVERSLDHLQTDYVDMLLIHRPDPLMDLHDIAAALDSLIQSGKVKRVGVSNFNPFQFAQLNQLIDLSTNQIELSLTQPKALFDDSILQLHTLKKDVQVWSPLGSYFSNPQSEQNIRIQQTIQPLAKALNVDTDTLLLAWVLHHPAQIQPVLGSTQLPRLIKALQAPQLELTRAQWFELLHASRGHRVP